jgi:cupin fold WbuC family metalloprotein
MEMKIDGVFLDSLTDQAKASPRLRMNLDLRNSAEDTSQRMLNAIEPGSVVPIHRHKKTSETLVVLRGRIVEEFYNDAGECTERIEVSPTSSVCALNIPVGAWHTLQSLESGTVILEMKDGAYEPIESDDILTVGQKASDDSKVQYCITAIDVHS